MRFGAILPHAKLFGGVKRFLELGNVLVGRGHSFTIFTPEGTRPNWFDFRGEVAPFALITKGVLDAIFVTEHRYLDLLESAPARCKIFYHVLESTDLRPVLARPDIAVFANSSSIWKHDRRKYGIEPVKAFGGVDTQRFRPASQHASGAPFTVITYGRLGRRRKGTRFVVRACERLKRQGYPVKLLLFDSPVDEKAAAEIAAFSCKTEFEFVVNHPVADMASLYQRATVFASAEKHAGWANTAAEAMACGLPVVATMSGSEDFLLHDKTGLVVRRNSWSIAAAIKKLYRSEELRRTLAVNGVERIALYSWERCADAIVEYVGRSRPWH